MKQGKLAKTDQGKGQKGGKWRETTISIDSFPNFLSCGC